MTTVAQQIARNKANRKAGLIPVGCRGWWHPTEKVVLHGAGHCPACDGPRQ